MTSKEDSSELESAHKSSLVPEESGEVDAQGQKPEAEPLPSPLDIILKDPSTPKEFRQFMGAVMRMGPMTPPYLSKITSEHITKFIESGERESERDHEERRWSYWFSVFCMISIGILFLIVM